MSGQWTESDSQAFVSAGDLFVPSREEQIETIRSLIPARRDERFTVVELGAGEGVLARAILTGFRQCRYIALDGSQVMREALARSLRRFSERLEISDFELADRRWRRELPKSLRCVLASLVIHHLPGPEKQKLFRDVASRLGQGGALLIVDIVEPVSARVRQLFAKQWDASVRARSAEAVDGRAAFARFRAERWNYYSDDEPDPYDQPSRLSDQLRWLEKAGLSRVDCFWMRAGHAIFGGYR